MCYVKLFFLIESDLLFSKEYPIQYIVKNRKCVIFHGIPKIKNCLEEKFMTE